MLAKEPDRATSNGTEIGIQCIALVWTDVKEEQYTDPDSSASRVMLKQRACIVGSRWQMPS